MPIRQFWIAGFRNQKRRKAQNHLKNSDKIMLSEHKLYFSFNLCNTEFILRNTKIHLYVQYCQYWDGTGSWNPFSRKTRNPLSYTVNTMVADDLATQGARAIPSTDFIHMEYSVASVTVDELTHWHLEDVAVISKARFSNSLYRLVVCALVV